MPCTTHPHPDVAMDNHNRAARAVNVLGLSASFRELAPGIEKCSNPEKAIHLLSARILDIAPVHPAAWAKIKAALGCPSDATSHQVAQAAEVAAELAAKPHTLTAQVCVDHTPGKRALYRRPFTVDAVMCTRCARCGVVLGHDGGEA